MGAQKSSSAPFSSSQDMRTQLLKTAQACCWKVLISIPSPAVPLPLLPLLIPAVSLDAAPQISALKAAAHSTALGAPPLHTGYHGAPRPRIQCSTQASIKSCHRPLRPQVIETLGYTPIPKEATRFQTLPPLLTLPPLSGMPPLPFSPW